MKKIIMFGIMILLLVNTVMAFTVEEYKDKLKYSGRFAGHKWNIEIPIIQVLDTAISKEYLTFESTIYDYKTYLISNYAVSWIDKTTTTTTSIDIGTISPTTTIKK